MPAWAEWRCRQRALCVSVKMHPSVKLELCMAGVMGCMIKLSAFFTKEVE